MTAAASGLLGYGVYLPHHRLDRAEITRALGQATARGTRSVAGYDEDVTTLAVEASRVALERATAQPTRLVFCTPSAPYADRTNANAVHAALRLDSHVAALDMNGAVKSSVGAVLLCADSSETSLVVAADVRTGLPGGAEERDSGDGAAALLIGPASAAPVIAELIGHASVTAEYLDRWRSPGSQHSSVWEERFGEAVQLPLADQSFAAALKSADLVPDAVDHLVIAGLHTRTNRAFAKASGVAADRVVADRTGQLGNTGAASPAMQLADVLDRCRPGEVIALTVIGDGATVLLFRATEALAAYRPAATVAEAAAAGAPISYADFLTWRGLLDREPPRRPDPESPAGPPSNRTSAYKFAFTGSQCRCGVIHLPPGRVCISCGAVDQMAEISMAGQQGTVVTFTIDYLAYTPSPPLVAAVIDFDGGGRFRCELTDCDPGDVAIGTRVQMTFRRIGTAHGIHNYFWKARPVAGPDTAEEG